MSEEVKVPPYFIIKAIQSMHNTTLNVADKMLPPFLRVMNISTGIMLSQSMHVAAKLEIPDLLKEGPLHIDDLAEKTKTHPESLYRLLRALSSIGIFKETKPKVFEVTAAGATLQKDHPQSVRPLVLLSGDPLWIEPWTNLEYSIKTGNQSFKKVFKKDYFEYLKDHKEKGEIFDDWMTKGTTMSCPVIAAGYPFGKHKKIVDVGGGQGSLLAHILRANPKLQGVLFDLPQVIKNPKEITEDIADRCELVGGDFFKSVPKGADIYIMQQIIHDWSDEHAVKILSKCREAMTDDGRILVVDAVVEAGNKRDLVKFIDLHMLVLTNGGKERSVEQFKELFKKAGLEFVKRTPTASMFSIIEAKKA